MKCVVFLSFLAFSMAQDFPTLPNLSPVTLPEPQEPSLEALVEILNKILESLHLPTINPEAVTFPDLEVEGGRVKRDIFSGATGLPSSPLAAIIELLNKILESLNLPTVNPESVTVPSFDSGRVKRDVIQPVGEEPSLIFLIEILNQILEALNLPTINPEEVTVPSDVTGRVKRDVASGITLPSDSLLSELFAKLLEIIAKLESLGAGSGVTLPVSRATRLPFPLPSL